MSSPAGQAVAELVGQGSVPSRSIRGGARRCPQGAGGHPRGPAAAGRSLLGRGVWRAGRGAVSFARVPQGAAVSQPSRGAAGRERAVRVALRVVIAGVWLTFGLAFKVAGLVPRHRQIVAAVVGESVAGPVTLCVGLGEAGLGLWVLGGRRPRACAAVQTLAVVAMNAVELAVARDLLLAPMAMLGANAVLLGAAWYVALRAPAGAG